MRQDAPPNIVKLAIARAIIATFDKGKWHELGLLTDTEDVITRHPRLLRSLDFGDDDYTASVHSVLPKVLGQRKGSPGRVVFDNLSTVEDYVGVRAWVKKNEPEWYGQLYGEGRSSDAPLPAPKVPQSGKSDASTQVSLAPVAQKPSPSESAVPVAPTNAERRAAVNKPGGQKDDGKRRVFLVHGRDADAVAAMKALLRAFDLRIVEWEEAAAATGTATPYTGDVVRKGMDLADAIVVLMTPDDIGCVQQRFREPRDAQDEINPTGQARMNVVFEAGMAMALNRERTVLVEVGTVRAMSDTAGLNVVRINDSLPARRRFAGRLRTAGLSLHDDNDDWPTAGRFEGAGAAPAGDQSGEVQRAATGDPTEAPSSGGALSELEVLKGYLADPKGRIAAQDLMAKHADAVREATKALPLYVPTFSAETLQERLLELQEIVTPLAEMLALGVVYDRTGDYSYIWVEVVERLMRARSRFEGSFQEPLEQARLFPASFAVRCLGVAAVKAGNEDALVSVLKDAKTRDWMRSGDEQRAPVALHDYRVVSRDEVQDFPMWEGQRWRFPTSHFMRRQARDVLRDVIPDDDDYTVASDQFEYRMALAQFALEDPNTGYRSQPGEFIGDHRWRDGVPVSETEFLSAAASAPSDWPWFRLLDQERYLGTAEALRGDLEKMRRYG